MLNSKLKLSVDKENCEILLINKRIKVFGGFNKKELNFGLINRILLKEELIKEINYGDIKSIIIGEINDNPIGEIVTSILNRVNYLKDCSFIHLDLYSKEEFNLQKISFIEDPIQEYLDSSLNINVKNDFNENLEYFICKCLK